jgi:hypothetical protein
MATNPASQALRHSGDEIKLSRSGDDEIAHHLALINDTLQPR